jgi:predicted MPP superfamily phosphohydrolase
MEMLLYVLMGFAGIGLVGFLYFENKSIVTTKHRLGFEFLPKEFDGFTIVHLSDLHNKWFGENQQHLVRAVQNAKPDIIVFTGDIVDAMFYGEEPAIALIRQLHDVAPIYYVSGNHEWESGRYESLKKQLIDLGVFVLDNRTEMIVRGDRTLSITGIDDRARYTDEADPKETIHRELASVRETIDERAFKLLLVHRPEWMHDYIEHHFNLIFAGHAHGGQWNMPGIGPIFSPGQGMFPKLVSGIHKRHSTVMVISRGLGNSGIAFQRLFNRPEIIVVVLKNELRK